MVVLIYTFANFIGEYSQDYKWNASQDFKNKSLPFVVCNVSVFDLDSLLSPSQKKIMWTVLK